MSRTCAVCNWTGSSPTRYVGCKLLGEKDVHQMSSAIKPFVESVLFITMNYLTTDPERSSNVRNNLWIALST